MRSKASASRLSSVSVSTRLAASIVTVSVLALLAATYVGVSSGRSLSQELDEDQLVGLRTTAALGVVDHFEGLRRAVTTVAASPQTPFAIDAFARGHEELEGLDPIARESLISRYRAQYLNQAVLRSRDRTRYPRHRLGERVRGLPTVCVSSRRKRNRRRHVDR